MNTFPTNKMKKNINTTPAIGCPEYTCELPANSDNTRSVQRFRTWKRRTSNSFRLRSDGSTATAVRNTE